MTLRGFGLALTQKEVNTVNRQCNQLTTLTSMATFAQVASTGRATAYCQGIGYEYCVIGLAGFD